MLKILLLTNIFSGIWFYFNKIEYSNTIKVEAATYYKTHYYSKAAQLYDELEQKYEPESELIKINLAHSYYKAQNYPQAVKYYTELLAASDIYIRSMAQCQLGIIQHRTKKYKLALFYFKEALRTSPDNRIAAYNYELLKLKLRKDETQHSTAGAKGQHSKQQNTENDQVTNKNEFNPDGDKESDMLQNTLYQQQNLSKQRAEKILEYLQEQEMQYYHQIQKHVPHDSRKPDW